MKLRSAIAIILASAVTATITILTGCATQPPPAPAAPPPPSPTMLNVRFAATATLLRNGQVLITGGVAHEGGSSATAELYDPATGGFALTGGLLTGRARHTATLLQNGKVLIAGGIGKAGKPVRPAELYDPASGRFLATGNMLEARYDHTATLLANGKVLIAGGGTTTLGVTNIDTAELYDPASGTFSQTGTVTRYYDPTSDEVFYKGDQTGTVTSYHDTTSDEFFYKGEMNAAHAMHTATLLPNGDVLIAGGMDADGKPQALVELYNPVTGKFTPTGSMNLARREHRATLLQNGQVLITGGLDAQERVLAIAELYDPATGKFALTTEAFPQTGTTMTDVRYEKTASILPNGQVLIAGGEDVDGVLATAELYDPAHGSFTCIGGRSGGPLSLCKPSMIDFRIYAVAVPLADGQVLIAGGYNTRISKARNPIARTRGMVAFTVLNSAEIYNPASGAFTSTTTVVNARYGLNRVIVKCCGSTEYDQAACRRGLSFGCVVFSSRF